MELLGLEPPIAKLSPTAVRYVVAPRSVNKPPPPDVRSSHEEPLYQ